MVDVGKGGSTTIDFVRCLLKLYHTSLGSSSVGAKDIAAIVSFNYLVFTALVQGRHGKLWALLVLCDQRMCQTCQCSSSMSVCVGYNLDIWIRKRQLESVSLYTQSVSYLYLGTLQRRCCTQIGNASWLASSRIEIVKQSLNHESISGFVRS